MMSVFLSQLLAQEINNPALPDNLRDLTGTEFFGNLIPALISFAIVIGVIFFVFYLIYGAIQWISSGGDKGQMEQAKSKISNALIGIFILLSFFAILNLVECFFGIGLRRLDVGPFNITFTSGLSCQGGSTSGPVCGPTQQTCYDTDGNPFCWPAGGPCPN